MNDLQKLYEAKRMLEELGLPLSEQLLSAIKETEDDIVSNKICAEIKNLVEAQTSNFINDFDLVVTYSHGSGVEVKKVNRIKQKESNSQKLAPRHHSRYQFWSEFLKYSKQNNGLFANISPSKDNWLSKYVRAISNCSIGVVISQNGCRVELVLYSTNPSENKRKFDILYGHKKEIDALIPGLEWRRMNDNVHCNIELRRPYNYLDENQKHDIFEFFLIKSQLMMDVFSEYGRKLNVK